ncbi:MAG: LacI family transcriptional regulator, partial [Lachnospiraceae bacterium]|nr:LacI family transcriptional regulator [Lachnospiraceae bacterium]
MEERVRIVDIAEELGVSTATVSNVIHGKTKKISDETVRRVQELLEKRQYIPSMAGILLSQNSSRIIGVVVNDHVKYEGKVMEDAFVSAALNALLFELEKAGYFMMVKATTQWGDIVRFASMWNMDGLVLIGFCERDYQKLRDRMHIPFVVYDGFFEENRRICNLLIDNYDGGHQVGAYLSNMGHRRILCISDNEVCVDRDRMEGCRGGAVNCTVDWIQIPMNRQERSAFFEAHLSELMRYTAVFAMSDVYAVELIYFLHRQHILVPEDISVVGFDNTGL